MGCTVLGISFDTPEANKAFRDKFDFGFTLLSDPDHTVAEAYDVGGPDDAIARRISYLIDPDGTVARVYEVADKAAHAGEVLADLYEIQNV